MKYILLALAIVASAMSSTTATAENETISEASNIKTAVFAGGCFWCVESDFEKLDGIIKAVSGYTGGAADTADYKTVTYEQTGHIEAVEVFYDADKISYSELVDFFWRTIDPTDASGQFCDKGHSYVTAVFYADEAEQQAAQASLAKVIENKPFKEEIVTPLKPRTPFYNAEDYHQDYYKKNPIRYRFYRNGCGRDKRLAQLWGTDN